MSWALDDNIRFWWLESDAISPVLDYWGGPQSLGTCWHEWRCRGSHLDWLCCPGRLLSDIDRKLHEDLVWNLSSEIFMSLKDVELKLLQTCNVSNPLSDPRLRVRCLCLLASEHLKIETKIIEHLPSQYWLLPHDKADDHAHQNYR